MRRTKRLSARLHTRLLLSASAIALTFPSIGAHAQNQPNLDVEEIVVRGAALSQQRAIERKRLADSILDAVSVDDLGKLPDKNASEAIDRLPGVSISIDQGEGRFVSIRGAAPSLNSVTINGLSVGSVEENSRQVPLDIIGSELIGGIEVVKAVTPDLEHNAIGGYVNVLTASPFDFDRDFFVLGSAQVGDEEFSDVNPWAAELTVGGTFGSNDSIGVMAGISYSWRDYNTQGLYVDDWREIAGVTRGLPESHKFNRYELERERLGLTGSVEIQPDEDSLYYLRAVYSKFDENERRFRNRNYFGERESNLVFNGDGVSGAYTGQRLRVELRDEQKDKRISNYSAGGENRIGDYKFEYAANLIDNNTTEPNVSWAFRSGRIFTGTFDMSDQIFTVVPNQAEILSQIDQIPAQGVSFQDNVINDDGFQLKGDVTYDLSGNYPGFIKVGALYRSVEKEQDINETAYDDGPIGYTVGTPGLTAGETLEGEIQGRYFFTGPKLDFDGLTAFTNANLTNPDIFELDAAGSLADSTTGDFETEEDVLAGYLMANVDIGDWKVIGGLRIEHTDVQATGFDLLNGTDVVEIRRDGSYTDYLPGLHIQYRPDESPLAVRAAWTNTIGRAEFSSISPRRVTSREEDSPGVFIGEVSQGNPDLEAFESMNFDLSVEYYLGDTGIISAAAFYKDVEGFIVSQTQTLTNITFQDRFYSTLDISTPQNANDGEILGIEFNYQDTWTGLPGLLSGLGGGASLTLVDSEIEVAGRTDKLPFFRQADTVYSLFLFYQWEGLEMNLSYDWADDILVDIGGNADLDIYDRNYGRLDFKASYQLNDNYGVFLELQNINNEPLGEYQGRSEWLTRSEFYGMTGYIGANVRF